jgi:hypothetical protein
VVGLEIAASSSTFSSNALSIQSSSWALGSHRTNCVLTHFEAAANLISATGSARSA